MTIGRTTLYVSLAVATIAAAGLVAQGPMYDKVKVNLPYRVTVRHTVLEPGEYEIKQMNSATNTRILHIFRDGGMKLETTVSTIAALDKKTPESTKVVLHHIGDDYYFDKVWIQGKDYGYEFVLPDEVKSRQKERGEVVVATYESFSPGPSVSDTPSVSDQAALKEADEKAKAEAELRAQAERDSAAAAERDRLAQIERDRLAEAERQAQASERERQAELARQAQLDRERQEADRQLAAANTAPEPATPAPDASGAWKSDKQGAREGSLPATSDNWMGMILAGAALASIGAMLRREAKA